MRALAVLLLLLVNAATRAHAQATDLATIAQRSDVIVLARCVESGSHWDEDAGIIVTDAKLAVERSFRGSAATTLDVRTLGGRVGSIGMGASHASGFAPGARVIALLRRSRFGPYFVITSAQAGPLAVSDGPAGSRVMVGAEEMDLDALARWLGSTAR